eukprot:jgi/Hompol1/7039/HPOL_001909-RA
MIARRSLFVATALLPRRLCMCAANVARPAVWRPLNTHRMQLLAHSLHSSAAALDDASSSNNNNSKNGQPSADLAARATPDRMIIGFTCKVCDHRQYKSMSKKAYSAGVVIITCDGCNNRHLIADHLGWFDSSKPPGTIEDILKEKGEHVKRVEVQRPLRLRTASSSPSSPSPSAQLSAEEQAEIAAADGMLEWLPKAIADAEMDMDLASPSSKKQK